MQYSVLLLCFFCYLLRESHGDEDIESELLVSTALGSLSGSYFTSRSGRPFVAFRGIPYAKPPVDDLRFKDPVPTDKWDDVLDASQEGPKCNQFNWFTKGIEGVEDCLKLNVYTHDVDEDQLRPVMVWIHGGGFVFGSGNGETDIYGPANFMDKDIVFVTINYRLGPFGFLTTGDAEAPGNYGLLDQTLALKWVQQHIRSFGGDPDSVTIFGESAGGASVEFQVLSPHSKGLFRRAISQSGSASALWALYDTGKEYTRTFAQHFNCSTESSSEIVDCLKTKDAVDLTSATLIMTDGYKPLVRFGPRVDRERNYPFLPAHPHQLIKSKSFNHVPYITGMNKNEGAMVIALLLMENGTLMEAFEKDRAEYIRYSLLWEKSESGREMAAKVLEFFDKELPLSEQLETIDHVYSDAFFSHSIDQAANLYAKFNEKPTYYYHYAHRGAMSLGVLLGLTTDIDIGVGHGDELFLLFDNPMVANHTTEDLEMSKLLIDLWTSFASHGAPESDLDFHWLPMSKDERRILNIDANPSMTEKLPFHDRIAFWNQLLDVTEEIEEETLLGSLVNAWQHFVQSAEME